MTSKSTSPLPAGALLGAELRRLRGGRTLAEVGTEARARNVAGVAPATLSKWENAKRDPGRLSLSQLAFLLDLYGASPSEIADLVELACDRPQP